MWRGFRGDQAVIAGSQATLGHMGRWKAELEESHRDVDEGCGNTQGDEEWRDRFDGMNQHGSE